MFRRKLIRARRRPNLIALQAVWDRQRFPKILDNEAVGNDIKDSLCRDGSTNRSDFGDQFASLPNGLAV